MGEKMSEQTNNDLELRTLELEKERIDIDGKFKEADLKLKEQDQRISKLQVWIPVITIVLSVVSSIIVSVMTSRTTIEAARIQANTQIQLETKRILNERDKEAAPGREAGRKL